jgi:hypothetical protein
MDHYRRVPTELTALKRWCCWKLVKGTKMPTQATGTAAKSNDPSTWAEFESVEHFDRIATFLEEPYCGVDLDGCLEDNGSLKPWAWELVAKLSEVSYSEVSPSGLGIKFITRARKPDGARCTHKVGEGKQQIECYDHSRFWTITGEVYTGCDEIKDGQAVIDWLCAEYLSHKAPEPKPQKPAATSKKAQQPAPTQPDALMQRASAWMQSVEPASEGERNNKAFRVAGNLWAFTDGGGQRLAPDQVGELMAVWNSRNASPLPDDELQRAIASARTNGKLRADKLPAERVDLSGLDLSAFVAPKPSKEPRKVDPESALPPELLEVPGLIGDVVRHNLATAHYPLPELALAAALALMSTLTAGKVIDRVRTRTNLYVIGLALSGSGKDHGRKINRLILRQAGHADTVGPERVGSHAGIIARMAEHWRTLWQLDEIAHLVMAMQDKGSPHLVQISAVLMQLFSSADSEWISDAYGDVKKVKRLEYPHAIIYGTACPEDFWSELTEHNLKGGLIGRCLVFESPGYVHYQEPEWVDVPADIVARARWWLDLDTGGDGNLSDINPPGASPRRVDRDEQAQQRLHQHTVEISERRMTEDPVRSAIWSRAAEKTNKLALLFACSRCTGQEWPVIRLADADLAIRLNNWLTRRMLRGADRHVAGSEYGKLVLQVRRLLQERPGEPWTLTEITRRTRKLTPKQRLDILQDLQTAGDCTYEQIEANGKRVSTYTSTGL